MKKQMIGCLLIASLFSACNKELKLQEDNIDEIVAAMTLEEKALLVVGVGMDKEDKGENATVGNSAELVPGAAGSTHAIERLGIPSVVLADGPAGLRINPTREGDTNTYYCTHFPIGTLLASTWNEELITEVGKSIGNEVLEYGTDVLLAPALNIHRNPLCGRNFEYYSEDPLLAGKTAAAYVSGIQSQGVGTSVKHFALNSQESNRTGNNAIVSTRAIREIYLRGFETVVKESDPWTIMTSYNKVNGTYTSEDPELVETVLRGEWGYKGMVMTDWLGGKDVAAQMHAGNDMLQPGRKSQYQGIIDGVNNGKIAVADLDRNVKRILETIVRTPRFKGYKYSNKPDLEAHAKVTRQSATEGMVLLENRNTLPLNAETKNIAVYGVTSYNIIAGGTGSGNVNRAYTVNLLDGLKNAGYTIDATVQGKYDAYLQQVEKEREEKIAKEGEDPMAWLLPNPIPAEIVPATNELASAAQANDVAVITLGRISGEFLDRSTSDFNLSAEEKTLIQSVSKTFQAAGKKVIVVLNIGGVIETASWKNIPDAILLAWQAGQEGGNSVADVLSGKVSPSGKLPMTWPIKLEDHASTKNFPRGEDFKLDLSGFDENQEKKAEEINLWDYTNYEEGIYVGYRWFDKENLNVCYPFGYGLSYTAFEYSNMTVKQNDKTVTVSVDIKNVGSAEAKEVVQLYAAAPGKDMDKPTKELRAYAKTKSLKAGEAQTITMSFPIEQLASYDEAKTAWVVEAGNYQLMVGASSRDIRLTQQTTITGSEQKTNDVLKKK